MKKSIKYLLLSTVLLLVGCNNDSSSTGIDHVPPTSNPYDSSSVVDSSTSNESPSIMDSSTTVDSSSDQDIKYEATPTIYLAGDSTVKTYNDNQFIAGWGQYLDLFLKDEVKVVNCANGGRSSRSFINEGRLFNIEDKNFNYSFSQNDGKSIEDCIQKGDYLFIQFGHNDDNTKMSSSYSTIFDRMVPLGTPNENGIYPTTPASKVSTSTLPSEYTNLASDSEESKALTEIAKYGETYYAYDSGGTYKWYLKQYIDFARSKGATPVLITPVARVKFSGNEIIGGAGLHGENFAYVEAVRQLALEENCLLIDLFKESKSMLETATSAYANYLMALKPNELVGSWPVDYDVTYGNTSLGYTGIEATHYNKYGAFLQAAKVAEAIINYSTNMLAIPQDDYSFKDNVLQTPKAYVDPSNLISKSIVSDIECLFIKMNISGTYKNINVVNPNRTYKDPSDVVVLIEQLTSLGEVTNENYLSIKEKCEEVRNEYNSLNIDDKAGVTNLSILQSYENDVKEIEEANRPKPTSVETYGFNNQENRTISTTEEVEGLKLVATSDKTMEIRNGSASFVYNDIEYSVSKILSLGGSAKFGTNRYVEVEVSGACKLTVVAKSSGSSDRTLDVRHNNSSVGTADAKASLSITTIDITNAGTYQIGSTGSGIYIYYIIVEYFN